MSGMVLNEEVTWARYELGEDFFEEYIQYFQDHAQKILADLKGILLQGDMPQIAASAHDLKGLCFNLGLEKFAAHLAMIEKLSTQGASDALETAIEEIAGFAVQGVKALEDYRDRQKD